MAEHAAGTSAVHIWTAVLGKEAQVGEHVAPGLLQRAARWMGKEGKLSSAGNWITGWQMVNAICGGAWWRW